MDDDIVIEPESLERTYAMLSFLLDQYKDSFIGGAMLRLDDPGIVQESGAIWQGDAVALDRGMDVRNGSNVAELNKIKKADYNAWWYCCFPIEKTSLTNLPLPFFIHGDDIEFGLRNCRNLILLNGIGVWHEVFEGKRSSSLEYYDIRNYLIINGIYRKNIPFIKIAAIILKRTVSNIMRLRYKDALLNIQGIEDYLKGPEYWESLDITQKNEEIRNKGYQPEAFEIKKDSCVKVSPHKNPGKAHIILSVLTLNGAFFPKIKQTVLVTNVDRISSFFRIKKACFLEPNREKAVYVEFSLKDMVKTGGNLILALAKLMCSYKRISGEYESSLKRMASENYWRKYL